MFIITGGGTGIGRALALNLAQRNKQVLIVGRREKLLKETASHSSHISYLSADVTLSSGWNKIQQYILTVSSQIQGLIHNAGTAEPICPVNKINYDEWMSAMATNLNPALFLTQILRPQFKDARVLNISSGSAHFPVKGMAAYCVSKAALSMLTRCWQEEDEKMHVASVMPGIIDTDMQALLRHTKHLAPEKVAFYQKLKDSQHLVSPDAVATFLSWLLLDTDNALFISREWDIYDQSHHVHWLRPPHRVPELEI